MPPSGKIWLIILVCYPVSLLALDLTLLTLPPKANSMSSFISDISWAYAMLLTTPLVVTVGLSLTIPLSLIGEMITYSQYSSAMYWVGAAIVVLSFLFINNESKEETAPPGEPEGEGSQVGV